MSQDHIVTVYDEELNKLKDMVVTMGLDVQQALHNGVLSLHERDTALATAVVEGDVALDKMQNEIDTHAVRLLALRQPMAADLRTIIACFRISNDLERMGDLAKNIAKRAITLGTAPTLADTDKVLLDLSELVESMIHDVMDVFKNPQTDKAEALILRDAVIDDLHTQQFKEIVNLIIEDKGDVSVYIHYLFASKNIERIGDHVTNIAEQILYVTTGDALEDMHVNYDRSSSVLSDKS